MTGSDIIKNGTPVKFLLVSEDYRGGLDKSGLQSEAQKRAAISPALLVIRIYGNRSHLGQTIPILRIVHRLPEVLLRLVFRTETNHSYNL